MGNEIESLDERTKAKIYIDSLRETLNLLEKNSPDCIYQY